MKKHSFPAVYKITNIVNNQFYIGSTNDYYRRKYEHVGDLKRNKSHCIKLQKAWNKYGEKSFIFSILEKINDVSKLTEREQYFLNELTPTYNILKFARSNKGIVLTKKQIENLKLINSNLIIQSSLNGKKIKEWSSIAEAARNLKLNAGNIGYCCNGHAKSCGGFIFKFKDNFIPYTYPNRKQTKWIRRYEVIYPDGRKEICNNISQYCITEKMNYNHILGMKRRDKPNKYGIIINKI